MRILSKLSISIFIILTQLSHSESQPNIIFLLSDDQHWNETSVQMHPEYENSKSPSFQTPHLEKLAEQGMRFSAAYAPSSVCAPTRISIQTGMSPAALNWTKAGPSLTASANQKLIPPVIDRDLGNRTTFASLLKKSGYATAHYGKWHIGGNGPENNGYNDSDGNIGNEASSKFKDPNPSDIFGMTDRAISFMKKQKSANKPFYIQLSYLALHSPGNASEKNLEKFKKLGNYNKTRDYQRQALTADLDEGVGKLLDAVKTLNLEKNTYVIYMSDNGARSKKKGIISGDKGSLGEGGIRAVFIAKGPNIAKNSWCHQRIVGFDLFPTFCAIGQVEPKLYKNVEGINILPQLNGKKTEITRENNSLVFHFPHYQSTTPVSSIYQGDFKLLYHYETKETQLFNIKNDLDESHDLTTENVHLSKSLKKALEDYLTKINAKLPTENSNYDPNKAKKSGVKRKNKRNSP